MAIQQMPEDQALTSESQPSLGEKVEITVCAYPDGMIKLRVDGGEEIPVDSLEQALAAVRAFVEQEAGEGSEAMEMGSGPVGASEEAEFQAGFGKARGGY